MVQWLAFLCLLVVSCSGTLPPPERQYKILMLLPISSKSHRNVFMPLAKGLAERGHKIVMLSNEDNPIQSENIYEISHDLPQFRPEDINMFDTRALADGGFSLFVDILPEMAREIYRLPKVKELYSKRKEFDLIVIDHLFNELMYPFAHERTFITLATPGVDARQSSVLGNPLNPAYVPSVLGGADLSTVMGRMKNILVHIGTAVHWNYWAIMPRVQHEISAIFPDLPPLLEIERNQSLTLMNSHFSMDMCVPLLPSQIEVGCMHCRPGQPLPKDIQSWIDEAGPNGVVYFSLGSIARSDTMPAEYMSMFFDAFKRLDQKVIWKFESNISDTPGNVYVRKWLPQQDILAHPNVKLFITHGGKLSFQESTYHATPMLALPIYGDQGKNAEHMVHMEYGLSLVWEELTVQKIVDAIKEIIDNPKFHKKVDTASRAFRDQMESPSERAIFWTEYVIRHQGALALRSPVATHSWIKVLMLDVLALVGVISLICLYIMRFILKKTLRLLLGSSSGKRKLE